MSTNVSNGDLMALNNQTTENINSISELELISKNKEKENLQIVHSQDKALEEMEKEKNEFLKKSKRIARKRERIHKLYMKVIKKSQKNWGKQKSEIFEPVSLSDKVKDPFEVQELSTFVPPLHMKLESVSEKNYINTVQDTEALSTDFLPSIEDVFKKAFEIENTNKNEELQETSGEVKSEENTEEFTNNQIEETVNIQEEIVENKQEELTETENKPQAQEETEITAEKKNEAQVVDLSELEMPELQIDIRPTFSNNPIIEQKDSMEESVQNEENMENFENLNETFSNNENFETVDFNLPTEEVILEQELPQENQEIAVDILSDESEEETSLEDIFNQATSEFNAQ